MLVFYNFIQQFFKYNYDKFLIQYLFCHGFGCKMSFFKKKLLFTGERLIFDLTSSSLITALTVTSSSGTMASNPVQEYSSDVQSVSRNCSVLRSSFGISTRSQHAQISQFWWSGFRLPAMVCEYCISDMERFAERGHISAVSTFRSCLKTRSSPYWYP